MLERKKAGLLASQDALVVGGGEEGRSWKLEGHCREAEEDDANRLTKARYQLQGQIKPDAFLPLFDWLVLFSPLSLFLTFLDKLKSCFVSLDALEEWLASDI